MTDKALDVAEISSGHIFEVADERMHFFGVASMLIPCEQCPGTYDTVSIDYDEAKALIRVLTRVCKKMDNGIADDAAVGGDDGGPAQP